jgi:cytochrome c oxidase assembly factor 4
MFSSAGKNGAASSRDTQTVPSDADESDPYIERIAKTGCQEENEMLQLCSYEKKDWRLCQEELIKFRECWRKNKANVGSDQM